jgi:hypothetical protein
MLYKNSIPKLQGSATRLFIVSILVRIQNRTKLRQVMMAMTRELSWVQKNRRRLMFAGLSSLRCCKFSTAMVVKISVGFGAGGIVLDQEIRKKKKN